MVRVRAFLRIIREHEAKGFKDPYHALKLDFSNKHDPFITFDDMSTHPSNVKEDKPAGAYQIKFRTWQDTCDITGWPRTFTEEMQDRIAMYLLQARPLKDVPHPRRSALGYIMEGKVEKAVNELKLWNLFAFLPGGGGQQQMTMSELSVDFDNYVKEAMK
jgi:muramidase (phage lysozyme)